MATRKSPRSHVPLSEGYLSPDQFAKREQEVASSASPPAGKTASSRASRSGSLPAPVRKFLKTASAPVAAVYGTGAKQGRKVAKAAGGTAAGKGMKKGSRKTLMGLSALAVGYYLISHHHAKSSSHTPVAKKKLGIPQGAPKKRAAVVTGSRRNTT